MSAKVPATLVVAGMHRSGTSMLAGFLQKAGLFLGSELLGANESNKKGHFENVQFKDLHMKALAGLGQNEDGWTVTSFNRLPETLEPEANALISQNGSQASLWGWKDPRTCLFLNYWAKKLPDSNYLFIFRPPWEVADSLYRRGDPVFVNCPELAFQVWQKYNEEIIAFCQANPQRSMLVSIDEVVSSPEALIAEVNKRFATELRPTAPEFESALLVKGSRHYQRFVHDHFSSTYNVWKHLEEMSWRGGKVDVQQTLCIEDPSAELQCRDWSNSRRLVKECKDLHKDNQRLSQNLTAAQSKLEQVESQLHSVKSSRIWQIRNQCAPLLGRPPV